MVDCIAVAPLCHQDSINNLTDNLSLTLCKESKQERWNTEMLDNSWASKLFLDREEYVYFSDKDVGLKNNAPSAAKIALRSDFINNFDQICF